MDSQRVIELEIQVAALKQELKEETGKLHDIGVMVIDRMKEMDYGIPFIARKCGMMEGAESNYVSLALDELEKKGVLAFEICEEKNEVWDEFEKKNEEYEELETKHQKVIGHIGRLLTDDQKGQLLGEAMMDPDDQAQDIHEYLDKIAQFLRGKEVEQ